MPDDATTTVTTTRDQTTPAPGEGSSPATSERPVYDVRDMHFFYGAFRALHGVTLQIQAQEVTAFIGPSGCGKTTFLRCLNRMNDLVGGTRVEGTIDYHGEDLYGPGVKPLELRRRVGMVFQKPNPFPKSIYENIAFAPRANGAKRGDLDDIVESSLRAAVLWEEVKDKLKQSAFALSGGQQQRLCIARTVAVKPDVILMDEPCSALDPIATIKVEDLMTQLKKDHTIVVVTHNLQQAARVSDRTAFFTTDGNKEGGFLVESGRTEDLFNAPKDQRTDDYIAGRFG